MAMTDAQMERAAALKAAKAAAAKAADPGIIDAKAAQADAAQQAANVAAMTGQVVNAAGVVVPKDDPSVTGKNAPAEPKLSTNEKNAQIIAAYAKDNPAPAHQHYGITLNADGTPRLYWDTGWGPGTANGTGSTTGSTTSSTTGSTTSSTTSSTTTPSDAALVASAKQEATRTALQDFTDQLAGVGLKGLVTVIDTAIKNNLTTSQIKDTVRASDEYKTRFPGMDALQKQGRAINEATYISMEQGYLQTLHAYGLDVSTFGTTSALGEQIANLTSPSEFSTRVDDAANRVNKNPDVLAALNTYYNVDKATAIAYLLSPKQGMDLINKQVRASEIGAAASASSYKFNLDMNTAESLVPQIGQEDLMTLKKEFGTAGLEATTQSRLAQVEGAAYDPNQAIQAAVVGNAQAQLESQRRAARETQTRFGGQGSQISRNSTVGSI